jgi:Fur family ferric uptake transcriptional regulator
MKCRTHHHEVSLPEVAERFRRSSHKMTGARQAIIEILRSSKHPMSSKEIFAKLPKGNCDLATIYRSMHLLEDMGMVKRFEFGDGVARFELLAEGDDGHHHHLICTRCSKILEIEQCFPAELERQIADKHGFKLVTHKLEFFGVCPGCHSGDSRQ